MLKNQAELMQLVRGYQPAAVIMALVELDVCSLLAQFPEGASASELAEGSGLKERPLSALLDAAVALGLLQSEGVRYRNGEVAAHYLDRERDSYIGSSIKSQADQYLGYARLAEAVREGSQVLPDLQGFGDAKSESNTAALRRLLTGLHSGGKLVVPKLRPFLAPYLEKATNLLDVGCGAGTYALGFAALYPQLKVTLLDQPAVLKIASEFVATSSARERAMLLPADYKTADFGAETYDFIFFSQVLRTESPLTIQKLLQKAARALIIGGVVAIYDTLLEESRAAPLDNVLQNLTLALMYTEGGLFTPGQMTRWLEGAGLHPTISYPIDGVRPMLLTLATKPTVQQLEGI